MLSYDFSHNIYVGLFYDKKLCNFINLFLCILWDLFVMSLVLSWWKLLKTIDLVTWLPTGSRLHHPRKAMWKTHEKVQQSMCFASHSRLGQPTRWPARYTDQLDFKCDIFYSLPYYIYPHHLQNCKETI